MPIDSPPSYTTEVRRLQGNEELKKWFLPKERRNFDRSQT